MTKIVKNNFGNFLVILLIFSMISGWFFSGWPRVWKSPEIPPRVKEARADSDWYNTDWSHRKKITATSSSSAIPSTQTNFPMLISITDTDLRDDAQGIQT